MRKLILIAFIFLMCQTVHAGCCVIIADECTYWDLGSWSGQQAFCNFFSLYQMPTEWNSSDCVTMQKPDACVDGWTSPPSPKIQEIIQQARNSGGGGGGCIPKWNCSDWGACQNGVQTRTCVDKKHCGFAAPKTEQKCESSATAGVSESGQEALANENPVTNPVDSGAQPPITGSTVQEVKEPSGNPLILVAVIAGILVSSVAVVLGWFAARR